MRRCWPTYGPFNGWLDGQPAITRHSFGRGQVTYVGVYLENPAHQQTLLDDIVPAAGVTPDLVAPPLVEARRLVRPDGARSTSSSITPASRSMCPCPGRPKTCSVGDPVDRLRLEPYGVAVLRPALD